MGLSTLTRPAEGTAKITNLGIQFGANLIQLSSDPKNKERWAITNTNNWLNTFPNPSESGISSVATYGTTGVSECG
jgi:hypothetical protein